MKMTFIHPDRRFDCLYALNLCQTASMMEVFWIMLYTGTQHIFALPTTAVACVFVKQQTPRSRSNWRLYTRARDLTAFMLSTCFKMFQWCWYFGFCCTHVSHTYSVSQLQSSHVYLSRNSHPKVAQIDVYTLGLKNWLLPCSQRMPNCFNGGGSLEYAVHRYPTHIRSPNYCRRMCICQAIGPQKELKLTFVHSGLRFDWFCALNVWQTAAMMLVFWIILYTGTPHIFALPTAVIACVFVKQ